VFHYYSQIDKLVEDLSLSNKRKNEIKVHLQSLHTLILKIPKSKTRQLNDSSMVEGQAKIPFDLEPLEVKGNFSFFPPKDINIGGSFQLDSCLKSPICKVDFMVVMPQECMQDKDYLNQRYLRKRALYLAFIAKWIQCECKGKYQVQFGYFQYDLFKPVIYVRPTDKLKNKFEVLIHCIPEESKTFKATSKRFIPSASNLREVWFTPNKENPDCELVSTPLYNSSVMSDVLMKKHLIHLETVFTDKQAVSYHFKQLGQALKVLKVWLYQRSGRVDSSQEYSCHGFNGFMIAMVLSYLVHEKKIINGMSCINILSIFFNFLNDSDWSKKGIAFKTEDSVDENLIESFQNYFPVVFIGPSGNFNLCHSVSLESYYKIKEESRLALIALQDKENGFDALFMTKVLFEQKYDQILHIPNTNNYRKVCKKSELSDELNSPVKGKLMDLGGNCLTCGTKIMLEVLKKGLTDRVHAYGVNYPKYARWNIDEPAPKWNQVIEPISFGFKFNTEEYNRTLDKGPIANLPQAKQFRKFWGEKSECRQDNENIGDVVEMVSWRSRCTNEQQKRQIIPEICKYLLKRHCNLTISSLKFPSDFLEEHLKLPPRISADGAKIGYEGTGEEVNRRLQNAFQEVERAIRQVDLSLSINGVHGVSSSLRHTQVYPPSIIKFATPENTKDFGYDVNTQVKSSKGKCSTYVHPIDVICDIEGSSRWPDTVEAINSIKTLFYRDIRNQLNNKSGYKCFVKNHNNENKRADINTMEIIKDGFAFRIEIACRQEQKVLRTHKEPNGKIINKGTPQSYKLEYRVNHNRHIASQLKGMQGKFECFGRSCRLAKLWVNTFKLSNHVSEEAVELLVAHVFLNPLPYEAPRHSEKAFERFLFLLKTFDFENESMILDFQGDLKDTQKNKIAAKFQKERSNYPAMRLVTHPTSQESELVQEVKTNNFTDDQPHLHKDVLCLIKKLAGRSLGKLSAVVMDPYVECYPTAYKPVFTPDSSNKMYNVVIKLNKHRISRLYESSNADAQPCDSSYRGSGDLKAFPIVGDDEVMSYVQNLQNKFGEFAFFFYNKMGSDEVGVIWKPECKNKVTFRKGCESFMEKPDSEGKSRLCVDKIIKMFVLFGNALVAKVIYKST